MLETPRICRRSSVPNIKMSQTIAHRKLHFTPGLGQLSAQMVREWLLEGDFRPFFLLVHPWRSLVWSSSSVKTLCSYTLDCFVGKSQETKKLRQKIAASEKRIKKGLQAHPL